MKKYIDSDDLPAFHFLRDEKYITNTYVEVSEEFMKRYEKVMKEFYALQEDLKSLPCFKRSHTLSSRLKKIENETDTPQV
jgi:uncharacterized protein Yka (UPF0111/DUF47 family)